jgi:AraC family transcriptional regulator, regulatory protein of adaptative response / DNA-3-methyladenine glycosylase II
LRLSPTSDVEAEKKALQEIVGIGPWTAEYVAMRAHRDPDAFPSTDLILWRELKKQNAAARAESWKPWRAYAAHYLWKAGCAVPKTKGKSK